MANHLTNQTSPYLLQHSENPVDWYPWGDEAFEKAAAEDKPVFLSIGYSTCHWCHVMARESFSDSEIAEILNRSFVCVKVDKEERPDIDSIYMAACQAFTGSGGWPTSIFMTADQKPFFAGTYFPKTARQGAMGLRELLLTICDKWQHDRAALLQSAEAATAALRRSGARSAAAQPSLLTQAVQIYKQNFDAQYGGFGSAPKFPAAHNLLFLLQYYEKNGDVQVLQMAETTLARLYAGGIFDHIGYGFCRYATDRRFLVPHFEKMLYDNALLLLAYCKAFERTGNGFYKEVAEKIAFYVLGEMTAGDGGFFSAQDADSEGEEGKYYVFTPEETLRLLGEERGTAFNRCFGITRLGNFAGKSIPNLLHSDADAAAFDDVLPLLRTYRRERTVLHTDDKILTAWNALMLAAFCRLYRVSRNTSYLDVAKKTQRFIEENLCDGDTLYVSSRGGKRGDRGFLDDYAYSMLALLFLYDATLDRSYLQRAQALLDRTTADFLDEENGGFYLYAKQNRPLLFRPKETYDGAMPSGNSVMAYVLVRLCSLTQSEETERLLKQQLGFLCGEAAEYPAGYAMLLMALSDYLDPPTTVTIVLKNAEDIREVPFQLPTDSLVRILEQPTQEYGLLQQKTTFYVCRRRTCLPPVNTLRDLE